MGNFKSLLGEKIMSDTGKRLLSVKETAEILGISTQTIYNKTKRNPDGIFPIPHIKCGSLVKFDRADVNNYIEHNKTLD